MTPERWKKLKELCHLALDREPDERDSFLAKACSGDQDLRRDVKSMIARASSGGGILDGPIWKNFALEGDLTEGLRAAQSIPETIGRYRILRVLGEGGMGIVYEAQQENPRRRVALKVIRPGLANAQMLRRFDRESQVLARLHHIGIAQVYEAGMAETEFGPQPYFAMEFVPGLSLREYVETRRLKTREYMELVAKICDAVEHAHQQGIIHRDLKPGNILVDETGQPKILDFGVARVTDSDVQVTRHTEVGQFIGTLAYMSPEQVTADLEAPDKRSDVYAVGVILYELLANRLPYQLSPQLPEAVRAIREEDPAKLSSISRAYKGDIETIIAKALEKDKGRRYSSAAALATDIRKHLADEPITARPPSASYQLRKFARRHRVLVSATGAVFAVLVAGILVSTLEAVRARRAEQKAEGVSAFLRNDLLAQASASTQASPTTTPDPDLKVRTALDRAAARISGKFDGQPEIEAAIRETIGDTYKDLGLYPAARTQLERALELQRRVLGAKHPETLRTISRLGRIAYLEGNYAQSDALFRQALDVQRGVLGPAHPDTIYSINGLAVAYKEEGKFGQAEEVLRQLLEIERRTFGAESRSTFGTMHNLALIYHAQGKYAQAEALYRQALDAKRHVLGPEHPSTLLSMHNLAHVNVLMGRYAEAETLVRQTLETRRRVLGPEHPDTLDSAGDLAEIYFLEGKYVEAESVQRQALEIQRRVLGPENPDTLDSINVLANVLNFEDKYSQAEALYSESLKGARRALGQEHSATLNILLDFASLYQRRGKFALAETLAAQALAGRRHTLGVEHPQTITAAGDLALAYLSEGKFIDSESLSREALELNRKVQPDHWEYFRSETLLGASLAGQKKYAEAEPLLLDGYEGMAKQKERIDVPDWSHLDRAQKWLIELYRVWGKPEKAAEWTKKRPGMLARNAD